MFQPYRVAIIYWIYSHQPILLFFQAAGILTRLENGVPVVNGQSSLAGVNIGDVVGWAPTDDVLATSKNLCTGESFSGFTLVGNDPESGRENDQALAQLLNGEVDALWICKCQILSVAMLSISFF